MDGVEEAEAVQREEAVEAVQSQRAGGEAGAGFRSAVQLLVDALNQVPAEAGGALFLKVTIF